jgi:LysM repeat protein
VGGFAGWYNARMPPPAHRKLIFTLVATLLASCTSGTTATPTPDRLRPYLTPPSASATATVLATRTAAPLPTPTPFVYTIESGDTLIGIANRFSVTVDDILLLNQGLVAAALTPGQEIKIPSVPVSPDLPTPTPAPLTLGEPDCYPTLDGGLQCFVPATNPFGEMIENLTAQVTLRDADGKSLASQVAISPLNVLPPGQSIALTAFFPAPLPEGTYTPLAQIATSIRLLAADARYLPVRAHNVAVVVVWDGTSAQVSGQVMPLSDAQHVEIPAGDVWVAATAYDSDGTVVGVRRWESDAPLPVGGQLPFEMRVSSSGAPIARVEVVAEARRPAVTPTP